MTIRFPGRPGMTMAVATGEARLVLDPTIFLTEIKKCQSNGELFCANLGSSPNFAYHSQPSIRQPALAFLSDPFCFLKQSCEHFSVIRRRFRSRRSTLLMASTTFWTQPLPPQSGGRMTRSLTSTKVKMINRMIFYLK